ncbi:unnamed protein product [Rotaria sp. Silwood1]|nr:unnamed protein product [Rotaria sp. Silwood1]CAF1634542.1 unnamed protein product [Rotaria sp. Silwood1]CAF3739888.1 unnamed protein product [Rotaria sp. Silwood1]CAF3793815.1 unnamed protein product [Rotaria sp. Silwood1]CAF4839268.1 unnamed protein product [Rotaria sp. Silwood1]
MIGLLTTILIRSLSTSQSIVGKHEEFSLAFAGTAVHDMFNWLKVLILLSIEIISNMIYHLTNSITKSINLKKNTNFNSEVLTVIRKPLTERLFKYLDNEAIESIALGNASPNISLLKRYCSF